MYNRTLDTFKVVADNHSFTKAAEILYISHTAVIKQINNLETHLGVKLFKRTNHGVTLTAAGQCLYDKTLEIMRFSEEAIQEIQNTHFASPTTLRVGSSQFYPCYAFMDIWDSISDLCPQYQLKIVPIKEDDKRMAGLNTDYDFIVGPFNGELRGIDYPFIPIGEYQFTIAMPRRHPLAKKKTIHFSDLNGERLTIMKRGTSEINDAIRDKIEKEYPEITIENTQPSYSIRTFNQCVDNGSMLLSLECWDNVHPSLVSVPLDEGYTMPYGILTDLDIDPDMEDFIKALKKILNK